jgi:signal transduction histidine kinase
MPVREAMKAIATIPEPQACSIRILELLRLHTGIDAACFCIFEEPHLLVVDQMDNVPENIEQHAATLQPGINVDTAGSILVPIMIDDDVVAVLGIQAPFVPPETEIAFFVDALTIITHKAHTTVRHEKLGRNYSEFLRAVSHDLRTPLTSVQGFAGMLESGIVGTLNDQQAHFVDKILSGIVQMTNLVENIQDAGRFDPVTGFYKMERSHCDMTQIVDRIVHNYLVPAEKQDLALTAFVGDTVPVINADPIMIERAVTNLVDNAIKYTPDGGHIVVRVQCVDERVVVSVQDSGFGISPENQKMLFERHVRLRRKEHKRVKGSGLGLFIVRSVARRHGGEAWVESEENVGSIFSFSVPLDENNTII